MKKLVKVLTLVLTLTLAMALPTEAQAATKTLNITTVTHMSSHDDCKEVKTTGSYKVNIIKKKKTTNSAFIIFIAPKDGVYQIKMSGLNCKKNTQGINTEVRINTCVEDKEWIGVSRTCYFANAKDCSNVWMMSKRMYNTQVKTDNLSEDCMKTVTINCKLKKGDHLTIRFHDFDGLDGTYTKDIYMFNMSVKKK